jgi:outer membrane protein assembly factor BamB
MKDSVLWVVGVVIAFVLVSCNSQRPEGEAFDWLGWRGPNGDGTSQEADWDPEALSAGARILWRVNIGRGHSNVAIADGRLYTMGYIDRQNTLYCLESGTGREIWRYTIGKSWYEPNSTPRVDDGKVYTLGPEGELLCLNARNGKLRWQRDISSDFDTLITNMGWATSPVAEGELLLINANTKALGLDKNTGELLWSVEDQKPGGSWGSYSSPVVFNNNGIRCVAFLGPGRFYAVELGTGKVVITAAHDDILHPIADPVVADSKVFISLNETCYLLETEIVWTQDMEHSVLTVADRKLILLGIRGKLRIATASPSAYMEIASGDVSGGKKNVVFITPPVLCNGRIYCRDFWGDLICVDVRKEAHQRN